MSEAIHPHRHPGSSWETVRDDIQAKIAANLGVDPVRVKYFDPGEQDSLCVQGDRWMLWYDGRW